MSSNKNSKKLFYDGFHKESKEYKKVIDTNNFTYALITPLLNNVINKKENLIILDYGCGVGTTSLYLADKNNYVYGCDISDKAIRIAVASSKNTGLNTKTNFFNSNRTQKVIKDESVDIVLCLEVIEHVEKEDELIKLFHNKLKHGGLLLITTPSVNAPLFKLNLLKEFDKRVGHYRRYSKDDLILLMNKNKLIVKTIYENEGIIRNALFTIKPLGFLLKFVKWKMSNILTLIDNFSIKFIGGSDIVVLAQKK